MSDGAAGGSVPARGAGGEAAATSAVAAVALADAARAILGARHAALICHEKPDGDALGSLAGLSLALDRRGIERTSYVPDPVVDPYGFLPAADGFRLPEELPAAVDLLVTLDANEIGRFGSFTGLNRTRLDDLPIVNLDHHVTNTRFGTVNVVDTDAASTCEVVYRLLPQLGVDLDPAIATALATGLLTDTLGFRTTSTTPETLRIGADLLGHGAPLAQLADLVFRQRKLGQLKLWGQALSRVQMRDGVVWTAATREMFASAGAAPAESEGLIELLSGVTGMRAAVLFKEDPDGTVKVSMRSSPDVDVAIVAVLLGGGGHPRAAGATVGRDLAEAERRVLSLLLPN